MKQVKFFSSSVLLCIVFIISPIIASAESIYYSYLSSDDGVASLVLSDGSIGYHNVESVNDASIWNGSCSLTPLSADEYDRNNDGIVTVEDIEYIFTNVDTSYLYSLSIEARGSEDIKDTVFNILKTRFGVELESSDEVFVENLVDSISFKEFLDNYSFFVCLYSLCSGDSINASKKGELLQSVMGTVDASESFYCVMSSFLDFKVFYSVCNLSGTKFPGELEDTTGGGTWRPTEGSAGDGSDDKIIVKDNVSDWLDDLVKGGATDEGVALPDGSDLSYTDKEQLGAWLSSIKFVKEDKMYSALRVVRILLGIVCIIYSVLFFLAYWFDKMNNIVDLSLLGLLSLGRFVASPDDTVSTYKSKGKEPKLVNFRNVLVISGGTLALGVFILNGVLYYLVVFIVDKANQLLGGL